MNSPFFSVIIPTCNRNDLLALCLERLTPGPGSQTIKSEEYEVVVTDDGKEGSNACDFIIRHHPGVKWTKGPQKGPAGNRNNGAASARGEWLVFFDDDCVPDHNVLEEYWKAIDSNNDIKVFEGRVYVDRLKQSMAETAPVNETGGFLWTCNCAIKKDLFIELNGFDEEYYTAMEDVDFRVRLEKAGIEYRFVKSASVLHPWRTTKSGKDGWKTNNGYMQSMFLFLKKHPDQKLKYNKKYYLKSLLRYIIYEFIVGGVKYKGKGIVHAFHHIVYHLKMIISV